MSEGYAGWLRRLNLMVEEELELWLADFPDYPYRQWYAEGKTAEEAFDEILVDSLEIKLVEGV